MYFIALLPPENISTEVLKWKEWMRVNHGCVAALRSPAHITLVPPFMMKTELENELIENLNQFAAGQDNLQIRLKDFSHFKSRVIYINVPENAELNQLRDDLFRFLKATQDYPIPEKEEKFNPHITIATRDLDKNTFTEAWAFFSAQRYEGEWPCDKLSLLRHNKKNWDVISTSQFKIS
jgi:2'-5' RNA ligase